MNLVDGNNENTCRLCMESGARVSIHEENKRFPLPLSDMINTCLGLSVLESDDLPKRICDTCGRLLIIFYNYKNLCLQSDKKLRKSSAFSPQAQKFENPKLEAALYTSNVIIKNEVESSDDDQLHMDLGMLDVSGTMEEDWEESSFDFQSHKDDAIQIAPTDPESMDDFKALSDEAMYQCKQCLTDFEFWASMQTHIDLSPACEVMAKCKQCPLVFPTVASMRKHIELHKFTGAYIKELNKKKNGTNLSCFGCEKVCETKEGLLVHFLDHGVKVKYCKPCDICYQRFHQCPNTEKIFVCSFCPKKFLQKGYLTRHMLMHTEMMQELKFGCPHCPKKFTKKSSLSNHIHVHKLKDLALQSQPPVVP